MISTFGRIVVARRRWLSTTLRLLGDGLLSSDDTLFATINKGRCLGWSKITPERNLTVQWHPSHPPQSTVAFHNSITLQRLHHSTFLFTNVTSMVYSIQRATLIILDCKGCHQHYLLDKTRSWNIQPRWYRINTYNSHIPNATFFFLTPSLASYQTIIVQKMYSYYYPTQVLFKRTYSCVAFSSLPTNVHIGLPALHVNAFAKSGEVGPAPFLRHFPEEWGLQST